MAVDKTPLFNSMHYQAWHPTVLQKFICYYDRFVCLWVWISWWGYWVVGQSFCLPEVVSWDVNTISRLDGDVKEFYIFGMWISFIIDVEKVKRAIIMFVFFKYSHINVLPKYWWHKSKFFSSFYNTFDSFIKCSSWYSCEFSPLRKSRWNRS